jgi:hypothetical protein
MEYKQGLMFVLGAGMIALILAVIAGIGGFLYTVVNFFTGN